MLTRLSKPFRSLRRGLGGGGDAALTAPGSRGKFRNRRKACLYIKRFGGLSAGRLAPINRLNPRRHVGITTKVHPQKIPLILDHSPPLTPAHPVLPALCLSFLGCRRNTTDQAFSIHGGRPASLFIWMPWRNQAAARAGTHFPITNRSCTSTVSGSRGKSSVSSEMGYGCLVPLVCSVIVWMRPRCGCCVKGKYRDLSDPILYL